MRKFEEEGQTQPLGVRGEGLFKYMASQEDQTPLEEIKKRLRMLDWFDDFSIAGDLAPREQSLQLHDRYLHFNKQALHTLQAFDQRSANEGFLFILFYTTLFVSNITPRFFAIDNIDASLNPGLCM